MEDSVRGRICRPVNVSFCVSRGQDGKEDSVVISTYGVW